MASRALDTQDAHIELNGEPVPVTVRINRRARRVILKVDPVTAAVQITVPSRRAVADALVFASRQGAWIAARRAECPQPVRFEIGTAVPLRDVPHMIAHAETARRGVWLDEEARIIHASGQADHVPRRVQDWLKRQARSDLSERVAYHAERLGVRAKRVSVRDMRSRWGSCSSTGALAFSWRLILAPPEILDYVAAHEVAHLIHMDHSPAFWSVVRDLFGDPKPPGRWLKTHGAGLYRFGAGPVHGLS